ncbi:MAG: NlpC/P60 family protein, partial [Pseudomonadota bacterium]
VAAARGWIGTPYHHQASCRGAGCDCIGLVRGVWREMLGPEPERMPAYTPDWAEARGRETLLEGAARHFLPVALDAVQPGDILLFRWKSGTPAKHVGISAGPTFIHAYDSAGAVVEGALSAVWKRKLAAAFSFPGVID